jgi:hypothetical protein
MMEFLRLAWPIFPVLAFSLGAVAVRRWWQQRRHRKADGEQALALTPLANSLGGEVVGADGATAWSAELRGPLANHVDGFVDKLLQRSAPRFDLALDFQRGAWHVRVSQASMRQQNSNGVGRLLEHRVEVATVRLAPMRLARRQHVDFRGRPVPPGHLGEWMSEAPLTAVRDAREWLPLRLPPGADQEFVVFASDLAGAERAFNPQALEWLGTRLDVLPPLVGRFLSLTFEGGVVYTTLRGHIDQETVLPIVDTIVGLLDRMPDARPRHPASTA